MMKKTFFVLSIIFLAVFAAACSQTETTTETTTTTQNQTTPQENVTTTPASNASVNVSTAANVSTGPQCNDEDHGINTLFPSDVIDINGKKTYDSCVDSKTLAEATCGKDGLVKIVKVGCLYGAGCRDGACATPPQETSNDTGSSDSGSNDNQGNYTGSTAHCTDTDGGLTYDLQGTCSDAATKNLKDSCIGTGTLAEWACHKLQDKCVQVQYSCNCATGACQ